MSYIRPIADSWLKIVDAAVHEAVFGISSELVSMTASQRAEAYVQYKTWLDTLDEALKPARAFYAILREKAVPEAFEDEGLSTLTLASGYRVTISKVLRASVREGKKEDAHEWLRANDLGDIIIPTVNASTLSAVGRRLMEEGKDLPGEIFNAAIMSQVSVTAVKK